MVAAFLAAGVIAGVLVAFARLVFDHVVDEESFRARVLVLGAGNRAMSLARLRRRSDQRGYRVMGYLAVEGDAVAVVHLQRGLFEKGASAHGHLEISDGKHVSRYRCRPHQ